MVQMVVSEVRLGVAMGRYSGSGGNKPPVVAILSTLCSAWECEVVFSIKTPWTLRYTGVKFLHWNIINWLPSSVPELRGTYNDSCSQSS